MTTADLEPRDQVVTSRVEDWFDEWVAPVWKGRVRLTRFVLVVGVMTILINIFVLPTYFRATTTLMPGRKGPGLGLLPPGAEFAQLTSLLSPETDNLLLYPSLIVSNSILRSVIAREFPSERFSGQTSLLRYFDSEEDSTDQAIARGVAKFRSLLEAETDAKTGIVTVSLEMPEPLLAAQVLNALVAEVDQFMRMKWTSSATERVGWLKNRIEEVSDSLHLAEESLRDFRDRNRAVSNSPNLLLEQARLMREVEVRSTIYIELSKQLELARLDEVKNLTIVNVLDPAIPPVKKARPRGVINTGIMVLLALIVGSTYLIIRERDGPRLRERLSSLSQPASKPEE